VVLPTRSSSAATIPTNTTSSANRLTPVALHSPAQTPSRTSTVARFALARKLFPPVEGDDRRLSHCHLSLVSLTRKRASRLHHTLVTCHLSPVTIVPLPFISRARITRTRAHLAKGEYQRPRKLLPCTSASVTRTAVVLTSRLPLHTFHAASVLRHHPPLLNHLPDSPT
jgi:hypothetical protein